MTRRHNPVEHLFDPMRLIHRAIDGGFIDPGYAESSHAMRVAEEIAEEWGYRWPEGEGFGSSDFTYALADFLDALGVPVHFVGGRLTKKNPRGTGAHKNPAEPASVEAIKTILRNMGAPSLGSEVVQKSGRTYLYLSLWPLDSGIPMGGFTPAEGRDFDRYRNTFDLAPKARGALAALYGAFAGSMNATSLGPKVGDLTAIRLRAPTNDGGEIRLYIEGNVEKKNPRGTSGRRNPAKTHSTGLAQRHGVIKVGQAVDIRIDSFSALTLRVTGIASTYGEIEVTGTVLATDMSRRHMLAKVPKVGDVVTVPLEAVDAYFSIPRG